MAEEYMTDDEQLDAFKRWIAENWAWLLAGIVIGVGGLSGYRFYESHRTEVALQASARFTEMGEALQRSDRAAARRIADGLVKDYARSPYADHARLTLARLSVDDGALDQAAVPLTAVMNDSKDSELRHIARLRLARVLIDQGKPDDAIKTLADDTPGAFASRFHEVRGDAFYAKHDTAAALKEYQAALGAGEGDAGLIELKIADLGGAVSAVPAPTAAIAPPSPSPVGTTNKAKP